MRREWMLHVMPPVGAACAGRKPLRRCGASSPLRTETPLRDVPVLRSAYFHKEYTVLFAPKRSTFRFAARTLRVTSHRNGFSSRSGVAHGLFSFRTDPPSVRRCFARLIRQAETLELQPLRGLRWAGGASLSPFSAPKCPFRTFRCSAWLIHDFAPSPMRALVFRSAYLTTSKRSSFRFASLTLRCRTEPALQAAPVFRPAYS